MSEPREWTLHGFTEIVQSVCAYDDDFPRYRERIVGPRIGDGVIDVIEKSAYDALKSQLERRTEALKEIAKCDAGMGAYARDIAREALNDGAKEE